MPTFEQKPTNIKYSMTERFTQYPYMSSLTGKRKNDSDVHVFRLLLQYMAEQNCLFPVQGLVIVPASTDPHRRRHYNASHNTKWLVRYVLF